MRALLKTVVFVISFAVAGSAVSAAFAETQWERNHPRRDQVNDRLAHQNHRIDRELNEGEISKQQANQLHREDHAIRHEERAMAKFNGGHITKREQKALNQQENAVSGQIGR
jgi:Ulp1 family protease